jgi:transposase
MSPEAVRKLLDEHTSLTMENAALKTENERLDDELQEVKDQLTWLKRQIFGQKTERFIESSDRQTALDLGVQPSGPNPAHTVTITYDRKEPIRHTPHSREEIPAHLPRKKTVINPTSDTTAMKQLGEKVTEQLHCTPAQYWVDQIVRPVFVGMVDGERKVVCAELPPLCNEKGKYGSSMIAQVTTAKFEDHTPIYRQQKQIERDSGMKIPESSLDQLPKIAAFWLEPVARRCEELLKSSGYVQMDESTVRVMIQPTMGKSTIGQMWVRHSPLRHIVVFNYDRHRNAAAAQRFIGEYQGILQTDCYSVYERYSTIAGIIHAGCAAHARRGFDESLANDNARATHALELFQRIFAVEQEAKAAGFDCAQRLALRQDKSKPIVNDLKKWLEANMRQVKPKSRIGKAIAYCLNHWDRLIRFLEDGRIEPSNNLIENCIRHLALGRKNWLFVGSEEMAKMAAIIYTVQGTCKLHGVNFFKYVTAVLEELPMRKAGDIDDLLPMNWNPPASN